MNDEKGSVNIALVAAIILALTTIGAAIGFGWAYQQMGYYRDDSDIIVSEAVEIAKTEQQQLDSDNFVEEAKKPYAKFDDQNIYGSVKFDYPKTWSVYNGKNGNSGYESYFHPGVVPAVGNESVYALRLTVENKEYEDVLNSYSGATGKGELTARPLTVGKTDNFDGYKGMRIDGQITKTINGSMAIFKIRDKTLTLRTDSQLFIGDFENVVLATLQFQP
jgi:hypothetical protein